MSDLHANLDSPLATSAPDEQSNLTSRWKRTVIGLFLPGMGQLFNRQPRKALVISRSLAQTVKTCRQTARKDGWCAATTNLYA
jgi:hypothetical protein